LLGTCTGQLSGAKPERQFLFQFVPVNYVAGKQLAKK